MLATLALQLLLAQAPSPPKEAGPEVPATEGAAPGAARGPASPLPPAPPDRSRQLSLLSAEPLGGGSAALAWAGWSSLGIAYGQGVTALDDLAAQADFDWALTELRLGGFYRRPIGRAGAFDVAGRLAAAWYRSFGATWVETANHSDHGLEASPGVSLSTRAGGGVFSSVIEAPLTITLKSGGGLLFSPRISLAYEAPIYPDVTLGARLGVGYRAGSGDAPAKDGHGDLLFLVTAGYQLL